VLTKRLTEKNENDRSVANAHGFSRLRMPARRDRPKSLRRRRVYQIRERSSLFFATILCEQFADRVAAVGDGEGAVAEVVDERVRIDAQELVDRGHDVAGRNGVIFDAGGRLVGRAQYKARFRATTGQ